MPILNIESLLQPISAEVPCGPDLEYDPAFLELDRLSEGKPEQQMGKTIVPAQEPDWKEVADRTLALLAKTKDIRIAVRLTRFRSSSGSESTMQLASRSSGSWTTARRR